MTLQRHRSYLLYNPMRTSIWCVRLHNVPLISDDSCIGLCRLNPIGAGRTKSHSERLNDLSSGWLRV